MKALGATLLVIGLIVGAVALGMKTTVTTEPVYVMGQSIGGGQEVNNIGLQADKQNTLLVAGVLIILGGIFLAAGTVQGKGAGTINTGSSIAFAMQLAEAEAAVSADEVRKCPKCAEYVKREAEVCRYCGYDLTSVLEAEAAAAEEAKLAEQERLEAEKRVKQESLAAWVRGNIGQDDNMS